jgi:hypothetical protein
MTNYHSAALGLLLTSLVFFTISSVVSRFRHARRAREWGCLPVIKRKAKLPFGIDFVWGMIQADREQILPAYIFRAYQQIGRPTWRESTLGTEAYMTTDPKNIQAILATQFSDFELGETRRRTFFPLLGNGIFTSDGKAWWVDVIVPYLIHRSF